MTWFYMNSAGNNDDPRFNGTGVSMFAMHFVALASLPTPTPHSLFALGCKGLLESFGFYARGLPKDTPLGVVRDLLVDQCCSFWWQANMVAPGHGMYPKQVQIKKSFQMVFGIEQQSHQAAPPAPASAPAPAPASAMNGSMLQGLLTQEGKQIGSTPSV